MASAEAAVAAGTGVPTAGVASAALREGGPRREDE